MYTACHVFNNFLNFNLNFAMYKFIKGFLRIACDEQTF